MNHSWLSLYTYFKDNIMAKKHTIHPENCKNRIRETVSFCGVRFTLSGKYGHEWSIMKESNGKITVEIFPNRIKAKKEFDRYKKANF